MPTLLAIDLVPSFLTHHDVATLFAWCPGFLRSALVVNAQGRSVGSAVIEVSNPGDAQRIIQAMDGVEIAGTAIRVSRLEGPPQEYGFGPLANATDEGGRTIRGEAMQHPCAHQRAVDEFFDKQGRPTGRLLCIERVARKLRAIVRRRPHSGLTDRTIDTATTMRRQGFYLSWTIPPPGPMRLKLPACLNRS